MISTKNLTVYSDSKSHYEILDGLRGLAAIIVVMFHVFEIFTGGDHTKQIINHGYLAVDFFFVLSGFVIGYAYDDRWKSMSIKNFFKRRLIRLHPMIIMGMLIGAITFYFQKSDMFPNIAVTPVWQLILIMLVGFTLLPLPLSGDVRGWHEMHPLNGPAWSLFFEYLANILYALVIRRFSNKVLAVFVLIFGALLIHMTVTNASGDVIGGWSLEPEQLRIGFTRLLYPFFAGLLMSRIVKPGTIKHAFVWCALILMVVLAMPRVGLYHHTWMNGLYDSLSIILIFPLIVYIGASGRLNGKIPQKLNRFLGDISYPLYITHYPLIYMYAAWVDNNGYLDKTSGVSLPLILVSVSVLIVAILIAYASSRLYDIPVRKWLTKKYLTKKAK